jgi:hypothetical protein
MAIGLLLVASLASAEQVRVIRDGTTIWRAPNGTGGVLTTVRAGAILEVEGRLGRWLIVDAPDAPGKRGYILEQLTAPADQSAGTPRPAAPVRQLSAAAPARQPPRLRTFLYVGGSLQSKATDFSAVTTVVTSVEDEIRHTSYVAPRRPAFEIAGGQWINARLSGSVLFVTRSVSEKVDIAAQIPNPLYFNQPRALTGQSTAERTETAVHAQIGVSVFNNRRLQLVIAGGPSYFSITQDLLDTLAYGEAYPYDTVTFTSAAMKAETAHAFGGHGEATALVPFTPAVALQLSGRWMFENVKFTTAGVPAVGSEGRFGVGLRLRF